MNGRNDLSVKNVETSLHPQEVIPYSLCQLVRYFLFLGTLGFGGPVALVGYMRRDLVEQRAWISESDDKEVTPQETPMRRRFLLHALSIAFAVLAAMLQPDVASAARGSKLDTAKIEQITGMK